jgi:hypothetical protein
MSFEEIIAVISIAVSLLLLGGATVGGCKQFAVDQECKRLGYREGSSGIIAAPYCITRSEQTDIVVPLAEARAKAQKK